MLLRPALQSPEIGWRAGQRRRVLNHFGGSQLCRGNRALKVVQHVAFTGAKGGFPWERLSRQKPGRPRSERAG